MALFFDYEVFVLPDFRAKFGDDLRSFYDELNDLLSTLARYYESQCDKKLLISPIKTILHPLPKKDLLKHFVVEFGEKIDIKELKTTLLHCGYNFVDIVESKGEVSFRGDIIDIYSPLNEYPKRISLFDDEIESIRNFSPSDQKSIKDELENFKIYPALFSLDVDKYNDLQEKIQNIKSDAFLKDMLSLGFWAIEGDDFLQKNIAIDEEVLSDIDEILLFHDKIDRFFLTQLPKIPKAKEYKEVIVSDYKDFLKLNHHKKITILASSEAILKQLMLEDENINFIKTDLILNVANSNEVIISLNSITKKKRKKIKSSIVLDELKNGDYIVHENYGIGIFRGLQNTQVLDVNKDFVLIEYQGNDKLLLPVENLDLIDKYISQSGVLAVIDKLGKGNFAKLKEKAKEKLFHIASQIVEMAAKRELIDGKVITIEPSLLHSFERDLGFEYTKDQQKAVEDVLNDLKSTSVMDRLLSADVGFGKTEVAMNAILAAVKSGFQVLFLVPTTLLSAQHFKTLNLRLSKFDVKIGKLDRFTSTKEKNALLKNFKDGSVDVLVGTHALLNVEPYNLGLLVIDEEHKFGVKQKEQLKAISSDVHLLSMSATPIPRSLNMALSHIKGYSQILTPPNEREDVRSFVKEYNESLLKEVFLREIRRAGQIFYVHNRISSIEQKEKELKAILPNLRILTLHSQINATTTEKEMLLFEEGKYDLLLSTSIIESGIHLPNVNTIIIENADRFGMADLHQLRGRVGRGSRQGFCYFLVEDKDTLTEEAKKRLVSLEANSFLGSGSILAYHDLEIRGGGNLIGEAQSGHIKNIGYSLYLRMLEDAINMLLNKQTLKRKEVDLKLSISAFLSNELISEDRIRLELYRRLSKCENVSEIYEIEAEIEDRFGKIDTSSALFLQVIIVKILASQLLIKAISNYEQNITIIYEDEKKIFLKSASRDSDDILNEILVYLRSELKNNPSKK